MASSNLDVLPSPPQPSRIGGGSIAADRGNSDLSRVDRGNVVALVGYTKTKLAPIREPLAAYCLKFPKGCKEELSNIDPLYTFHIKASWSPAAAILKI